MKVNPTRAKGKRNRHAEMRLRFGYGVDRQVREVCHARSFIALWHDQFGTVHFTATGNWDRELEGIGSKIRDAYQAVKS
jgi:hypothetical protein